MSEKLYEYCEQIIKTSVSYKDDFTAMKIKGDFWPAIILGTLGFATILFGVLLKYNLLLESIIIYTGIIFLSLGLLIRRQTREAEKTKEQMFLTIWKRGKTEWIQMINYFHSQLAIESIGKLKISENTIVSVLGSLAIGHFISVIGSHNREVNSTVAAWLIGGWALLGEFKLLKKNLYPSRKDKIEMALKLTKNMKSISVGAVNIINVQL